MAPHVPFDTDQVRDKARKDLLYLLEGVSLLPAPIHIRRFKHSLQFATRSTDDSELPGPRQEKSRD